MSTFYINVKTIVDSQHLPKLQKEVSDWEQKFKAFEAIEDLRKKIGNLKDEMAWAVVSEKEKV